MKLDRTITPSVKQIKSFNIVKAEKTALSNGLPLYALNTGANDIIKIEWIFPAGNIYQIQPLKAFVVNSMLSEGSANYTSVQISGRIEYYGAHLSHSVDKDNAFISLVCQSKHLAEVLPVIGDLIKNPTFPEGELETFMKKHHQNFLVEKSKVRNIARFVHSRMLFGNHHPYGYSVVERDFETLQRDSLIEFHRKHYRLPGCVIVASGKVDDQERKLIDKYFGQDMSMEVSPIVPIANYKTEDKLIVTIEKPEAVQNAVRIGKVLFNKQHPDFNKMSVLNCVLGGYFGSRLMRKIREEKGYTYGINSLLVTFKHAGYFTIVSELGADVANDAIKDILNEVDVLRTDLIPDEELTRVKNYMLGDIVRMFDGSFAQAESLVSLLEYDFGYDYYDTMINETKEVTSSELRTLAQKYLAPETFSQVQVGKTNFDKMF